MNSRSFYKFTIYSDLLGSDMASTIKFLADWAFLSSLGKLLLVFENFFTSYRQWVSSYLGLILKFFTVLIWLVSKFEHQLLLEVLLRDLEFNQFYLLCILDRFLVLYWLLKSFIRRILRRSTFFILTLLNDFLSLIIDFDLFRSNDNEVIHLDELVDLLDGEDVLVEESEFFWDVENSILKLWQLRILFHSHQEVNTVLFSNEHAFHLHLLLNFSVLLDSSLSLEKSSVCKQFLLFQGNSKACTELIRKLLVLIGNNIWKCCWSSRERDFENSVLNNWLGRYDWSWSH